jgi:CTP:molybdopterin cytidylyltransferase MocA
MAGFSGGVAGLILAGGAGRRWGGPKAFARLPDGPTFLEACASTLHLAGLRPIAATVPPQSDEVEIAGLETFPLPASGLDMFSSLRHGLQRLTSDTTWNSVIVLPVDHPMVAEATVRRLASTGGPAIPSYHGKHGHPVSLSRELAENIAARRLPGPTLREVLKDGPFVEIAVDDAGVVTNCNTPEALASALRRSTPRP